MVLSSHRWSPIASSRTLILISSICSGWLLFVGWPKSAEADRARATATSSSSGLLTQVEQIDRAIRRGWAENHLTPSAPATDAEWCRRLYLDILGRIPTVEELNGFLKSRGRNKRAQFVEQLLGDSHLEQYANNWTAIWTNLLIGRTGGMEQGSLTSRAGMQQYLRRGFQQNKPYDVMVQELITASGTTVPGSEDFNGATNFLVAKYADDAVQATAKTAQIFLGLQVQCTQCHNHPFNDWKQNQFWELNAFFRQSRTRPLDPDGETLVAELADESFSGDGNDPAEAEIYFERRNGLVNVAYPVFVDGQSLTDIKGEETGNSGYLEDINRRRELAKLVHQSRYLERALVNRYWAHFMGYGFTKPIDDMGPHRTVSHPELLETLGREFRAGSFNLKELIRWIVLSEPYSLSSRMTPKNRKDDPALGREPMFSHFYLRQMRAEELYESLIVATQVDRTPGTYDQQQVAKRVWLRQLVSAFGTDEGDETTTFNGTIPQSLLLMNGQLIKQATSAETGSFLERLASDEQLSPDAKIRYLYSAALARLPTKTEIKTANELLAARNGHELYALQDIWWVLLNSNEFIFNH